jgi:3-deoxy-manno-octulosonate cytidylyltransferase (CMP-KDO synthetase)
VQVIKVDHDAHGVDTPEDLAKVEALMQSRHIL